MRVERTKARGVSRRGISKRVLPAYLRWVTFLCADKKQMNAEKIAVIFRRSLPHGAGFASLITLRVSRLRKTSTPAMPPLRMTRMIFVECEQHIKSANIAFLAMFALSL